MSRIISVTLLFVLSPGALAMKGEPCTIPRTGEAGECIFFIQCPELLELYRNDRTAVPTVCNKERRRICCPVKAEERTEPPKAANIESRFSDSETNDKSAFVSSQIVKKCNEFKDILTKNETISPFVFGEPAEIKRTEVCHQNKADIGVASELEFPHIAIIKLQSRQGDTQRIESKCIGSLVSEFHVITSAHCVHSDLNHFVSVQLGSFRLEETDNNQSFEVEEIEMKYGIAVLKLKEKVVFSERVLPICLFPEEGTQSASLLTGWAGDWRDCDLKLKKWSISSDQIETSGWLMKINESTIINYRQTLLPGAPLQIYHPSNSCQYSLIGIFEQLEENQYAFNKLHKKLRWIENVVWPRKLNQMSERAYRVINKSLKL